jgi:thymidylate synthase
MDTIGQVVRVPNMREGYVAIVKAVAEHGELVSPRGLPTREFQCATIICEDPFDTLPSGVGRGLVPGIAAVESAQLLAGESRPGLTIKVSPTFALFSEDDGEFHGAYGPRTAGQFEQVVRRLKLDSSSRQAVATIWKQEHDLPLSLPDSQPPKRDYPCTLLYHFMIRKDKLVMEVVMRSNDVILGLGYDTFQHSRVQIAVASCLGIEPGEYRHHAMSLHLYERDLEMVDRLTMPQARPRIFPAITGGNWDEIRIRATAVLDEAEVENEDELVKFDNESMQWYVDSMRKAIAKHAPAVAK